MLYYSYSGKGRDFDVPNVTQSKSDLIFEDLERLAGDSEPRSKKPMDFDVDDVGKSKELLSNSPKFIIRHLLKRTAKGLKKFF